MFFRLFKKKASNKTKKNENISVDIKKIDSEKTAVRKGELGEYKINIQLAQMGKEYRHLSDIMVRNSKSLSGFSQIDHILICPYGIFVIETKNYKGIIYGGKNRKQWSVNGKFKMLNPFLQNYGHIKILQFLLREHYTHNFVSIVSFTKRCTFKMDTELSKITSNDLIVYDVELSEFISRKVAMLKLQYKEPVIDKDEVEKIYKILLEANISDHELREQHKKLVNVNKEIKEAHGAKECVTCGKPVSDKVAAYCLENKQFEGKIYCFMHQKIYRVT